jgi:hypothetical protein
MNFKASRAAELTRTRNPSTEINEKKHAPFNLLVLDEVHRATTAPRKPHRVPAARVCLRSDRRTQCRARARPRRVTANARQSLGETK